MKIGTKSVLFGAHQFILHPLFLSVAWWRLYGFPWDPRLWVAFFVHDLGYIGKPNMDGAEGDEHPRLGAKIMHSLFDRPDRGFACPNPCCVEGVLVDEIAAYEEYCYPCPLCERAEAMAFRWHDFSLYHSRFMAKRHHTLPSRLCVADKMATILMPSWLYLTLTNLTGEIHEYMAGAHHKEGGKYATMGARLTSQREWFASMCDYMNRWIIEHRDGRPDGWTPTPIAR